MHERLKGGKMIDCLYQTMFHEKDYREDLDEETFKTVAGNYFLFIFYTKMRNIYK